MKDHDIQSQDSNTINSDASDKNEILDRHTVHDIRNCIGALMGSLAIINEREENDLLKKLASNSLRTTQELSALLNEKVIAKKSDALTYKNQTSHTWQHPAVSAGAAKHDLFFAAIEMTRMPMVVCDPNQNDCPIIFINNAFLNSIGYASEEVLGRNCRFLQGEGTDPETVTAIRNAIQNRTNVAVEIKNYRKDGTMFWNALFISPIFDADGKLLYFFGSQLDVTRRREAEAALRKAQKMEAIGQLTGGIAHDFNNLLQVMIGNLQMAMQFMDDRSRAERHINLVSTAADRARNLTQQLLAFSRKQALDVRVANLKRIISDLQEILEKTLGDNVELAIDTADDLWNTQIDTMQMEMSLINICVNARDAMGDKPGKVFIKAENITVTGLNSDEYDDLQPGLYTSVTITDTGSGMSPDVLAHVTEPFFTTKDVGKGTGLGLAQVYGFVKQSSGYLKIESEVGTGTSIRMLFPATRTLVKPEAVSDEEEQTMEGGKILIVEDNQEVLDLAHEILRHKGYEVEVATSARQALRILEKNNDIDLLFTDIVMPGGMNGLTLVAEARKMRPSLSILVTTGFAEDVHGQPKQSEYEILYKPYMPNELLRKVHGVLYRRFGHRS